MLAHLCTRRTAKLFQINVSFTVLTSPTVSSKMKLALCLVLAVGVVQLASAHTCLLAPMQRGGAANATTMVADPRCGLNIGPWYVGARRCEGTAPCGCSDAMSCGFPWLVVAAVAPPLVRLPRPSRLASLRM